MHFIFEIGKARLEVGLSGLRHAFIATTKWEFAASRDEFFQCEDGSFRRWIFERKTETVSV